MANRGWYRAYPPQKVSTLLPEGSKQEISSGRMPGIRFCSCGHPSLSLFLSLFSGAECLKPVKWALSLFSPFPLPRFADFLVLSLSLSLALQGAELGRRGFSSLMVGSFSRGLRLFFFLVPSSGGCRKF